MGRHGAPNQPFAAEARDYLASLILHKKVTFEVTGVDFFRRILAIVAYQNGDRLIDLNVLMVRIGLAFVYRNRSRASGDHFNILVIAEEHAKEEKRNIWSLDEIPSAEEHRRKTRRGGSS